MLEAETLIGHCILLEKAMNIKIDGVIDDLRFFWQYFHLIPSLYEDFISI